MINFESDQARATDSNKYPRYKQAPKTLCPKCHGDCVCITPLGEFDECLDCGYKAERS